MFAGTFHLVMQSRHITYRLCPGFFLLLGLFSCTLLKLSGAEVPADPRKPSTIRLAEQLEKLARQTDPMANLFQSHARVAILRAQFAADQSLTNSPERLYSFGVELLNAGENEQALATFDQLEMCYRAKPGQRTASNDLNLGLNRALCYLRMAEQMNCLSNHNADSCLLPIKGGGIHKWTQGSRNAIGVLTNLLTTFPDNLSARWLLNVAAMTVGDYPDNVPRQWVIPSSTFDSDYPMERFIDVAGPAGLAVNELSGGSAVEDFDGDGFLDIITTSIGFRDQMRYFHNDGNGSFSDRTRQAGLVGLTGGLNLLTADFNNDGFTDVLVLRGAWMREGGLFPNSLLKNNGDGTFEDVTEAAGLLSFHPTQTGAWFDFDGDGWLDLFIGNETGANGPPHPCELYHNNKNGTFTEMAAAANIGVRAFVKGVTCGDYNNDGRPDLYLSILGRPNMLLRNDGPIQQEGKAVAGWKFTQVAASARVQLPVSSFPAWFFDYDNDGWEDIFVSGYKITGVGDIAADYLGLPGKGERAHLYHNKGDGSFVDVSKETHLDHVFQTMGCNFGDLDNDGWLDFYLGTGDPDFLTIVPNRMFRNNGGKSFQDVTTSGGFGNLQKGHAVSFADFNNDGQQDVYEDMGGAVSSDTYPNMLYANPGHTNRWLKLQLVGVKANRSAIGARLKLTVQRPGGERVIYRTVNTGGSFGCNPLRQEIGLGDATSLNSLEIHWPGSGTVQTLTALNLDQLYRIREDSAKPELVPLKSFTFRSSDPSHDHTHHHQ
jgi:hypothetical protein